MSMNIPQIASVETAVRIYNERFCLYNKDIRELFPGIGPTTVARLKDVARAEASLRGMLQYDNRSVLTRCAYRAWGLDIDRLEHMLQKLKRLGIVEAVRTNKERKRK